MLCWHIFCWQHRCGHFSRTWCTVIWGHNCFISAQNLSRPLTMSTRSTEQQQNTVLSLLWRDYWPFASSSKSKNMPSGATHACWSVQGRKAHWITHLFNHPDENTFQNFMHATFTCTHPISTQLIPGCLQLCFTLSIWYRIFANHFISGISVPSITFDEGSQCSQRRKFKFLAIRLPARCCCFYSNLPLNHFLYNFI